MLEDIKKFFESLWRKLRSGKKKISPFVILLCALIVTIPTSLAVYYAYFYEDTSGLSTNYVEVNLYDAKGALLSSEKVTEANVRGSSLVELFYNINVAKKQIMVLEELIEAPNYSFTFRINENTNRYFCYFSSSAQDSFIKDENGNFFSIDEESYRAFLLSSFSEAAYSIATPPKLITGNGDIVTPSSVKWQYKKDDGKEYTSGSYSVSSTVSTYKIGGAVNLSFDRTPDLCNVVLRKSDGEQIYDGSLEDLHFVTVETGTHLNARITATWKNGDSVSCFGEQSYDFNIILGDRSEFYISGSTVSCGEFLIISATNVDDTAKMVFSIQESISGNIFVTDGSPEKEALEHLLSIDPPFVFDGELARAIIPFSANTPTGKYTVSIAFGATRETFEVEVTNKDFSHHLQIDKTSEDLSPFISNSAYSALYSTLESIESANDQTILFGDGFASPSDNGFKVGYSYDNVISSNDEKITFTAIGNEYIASTAGGQSVSALCAGIVVGKGYCQYLGHYVVLEHGMGLRTWYCLLSSAEVAEGDIVATGQTIGKCGNKGPLSASGFMLLCTVYETPIDPSTVIGKKIEYQQSSGQG